MLTLFESTRALKLELYHAALGHSRYRHFRRLMANEQLSRDAAQALQWTELLKMVRHAYDNVLFYRRAMIDRGLHPDDIRTPEDFATLPVLTKQLVRANSADLLSQTAAVGSYFPHATGGSTGEPVDFYRSHEHNELANVAGEYRSFHRAGWWPGQKMAWVWGHVLEDPEPPLRGVRGVRRIVGEWLRDEGVRILDAFDVTPTRLAAWVRLLRAERIAYIHGYASALANFAAYLRDNSIRFGGVRGIISTAEPLFPDQRRLLNEVFGCVVIDKYGSREVPSIATSCSKGALHINSDIVYVEFLDDACDRTMKRIVVTDLHNTVFPFIRYELGDAGVEVQGSCSCSLPFPVMNVSIGRSFDHFQTPDGRLVHGAYFKNLMDGIPGIAQFQFRQRSPREILLRMKRSDKFGPNTETHLAWVKRKLSEEFHAQAQLELEFVDEIAATSQGKRLFTICEFR